MVFSQPLDLVILVFSGGQSIDMLKISACLDRRGWTPWTGVNRFATLPFVL